MHKKELSVALREEAYFAQVRINQDFGCIEWPNGYDPSPAVLYAILAKQKIISNNKIVFDPCSGVATFVSHLLTFRQVEVVDVRPLDLGITGLTTTVTDATHMTIYPDNSLESISTLHAGEHFGLGRYGDPINPEAHILFMKSLARVLKPGGKLYYSVPSGIERLYFHAHRVISPYTILKTFEGLKLVSFSCVTDDAQFHENCGVEVVENQEYGCGMFEFTKNGNLK